MSLRSFRVLSIALAFTAGCQQKEAPAPEAPKEAPAPVAEKPVEAPKTDADCVGPVTAGAPEALTIGATTWELSGSTLTQKTPATAKQLVIGAVTDIKEDSPENIANLKALAAWYKAQKVDLVIVAGDSGETAEQIVNVLSPLAELKVPVFNIIGNREGRKAYTEAMTQLHAKFPNVFNLNRVRRIDTPSLDIVSMPGYFNANYIHAEDGCQYVAADLASVTELARASNSPVLLVSHGGPKQEGAEGIDRTSEGDNVGDPGLTKAIADNKIAFGIFGNIHEAGGRAVDLAGKTLVKQNTLVDSLYLHPGPADGVRWVMNDKTESVGMGALVTVADGKAKYEVKHLGDNAKLAKGSKKKAK